MLKNEILISYFKKLKILDLKTLNELKEKDDDASFDVAKFLLENNYISKIDYLNALSYYFNIPSIDLDMLTIDFEIEKRRRSCYNKTRNGREIQSIGTNIF